VDYGVSRGDFDWRRRLVRYFPAPETPVIDSLFFVESPNWNFQMEINGKVAIVTGAGGGGCGRAIAQRLAREGASVVVSDIDDAGGRETVRQIGAHGGRAAFFHADVTVESEIKALVAFAEATFGGLDILINSAGPHVAGNPLEAWVETIQGNLIATMQGTLHAIDAMRRRGGGTIVNFGSTSAMGHGRKHSPWPAYDVAKAGIVRLTTTLGWLKEKEGIRVNCIVPAWIASEEVKTFWEGITPEQRKELDAPDVLLTLDEIADAVIELVTNDSLAGRVMVLWNGEPRRLIQIGDPGYAKLE
jgi:NAD(P)-dependent dehydrogenase (short-subunit alcohol dehydrogenase family)